MSASVGRWLHQLPGSRLPSPSPGYARLVCLPHAGGAASSFRPWATEPALADLDVFAAQYPGREGRFGEALLDDMSALADPLARAVLDEVATPVILLGHSMGASVAVEVARRLEAAGAAPTLLILSGRRAPRHDRPPAIAIDERTDDDLVTEIAALGGTDPRALADPELRELVLPIVRNDYRLLERYRPPPVPLRTDVLALWGRDDPTMHGDPADWRHVTTGTFRQESFAGGHFFLHARSAATAAVVAAAAFPARASSVRSGW